MFWLVKPFWLTLRQYRERGNVMDCRKVIENLDDFMDGYLEPSITQGVQEHLADCTRCHEIVDVERKFRRSLRQMPVPPASSGFLDKVFEIATKEKNETPGWWGGFSVGGGLAVAIMIFVFLGLPYLGKESAIQQLTGVAIALDEPKTIQMVVNVPEDLEGSSITILLPEQVELDGYPGERAISWTADLQKGANLLALPLVARQIGSGTLVARVEHANKRKTFEVSMEVREQLSGQETSKDIAA